ncbi:disease resistance protein RGA2-like isoform X1 [Gossypium australe]|uniref:Disease resistance protein RGA2-like isoform X1 n=1 Tax=Gossypium australe TaxID=47621 RepID=A0A5B6U7V2_9ROSI|nr:disease resistance protein RGA2-like isoform X1 [Gossypium australe]
MRRKLTDIIERLDDIAREMSTFSFKDVVAYKRSDTREKRDTGPDVGESQVHGRAEDVKKIVDLLLSSGADTWVIPIVGIGGIGKTTLAQLVYNDPRLDGHFCLTEHRCESSHMGVLQSQLRDSLYGKRYLLVMDDVWGDDQEEWDKVRSLLRCGAEGSKIIVTTRTERVASIMSNAPSHLLEGLAKDDCWTLFKQQAFAYGEENDFPNLLPTGLRIIDKCQGVPLAAKVLGGLLRSKREEDEWLRVQESDLWSLDTGENRILSVLRLSFNHLPSNLKRCFAYCAIYPRNYHLNKEKLIQQWIAGGLAQSAGDNPHMLEQMGNECFNDLLEMSFFQLTSSSDAVEFKIPSLMYDLAKLIAGKEFLTIENSDQAQVVTGRNLAETRYAMIENNYRSSLLPKALYKAHKLCPLNFLASGDISMEAQRNLVRCFRHLKILNLSGSGIERLHRSIGDLIYLRYLDLSNTPLQTLPETVGHLCNLRTLDLSGCTNLLELPGEIVKLVNLMHLNVKDCTRLASLLAFWWFMVSLRTLPIVIPGKNLDMLHRLKDLQGELKIKYLENCTVPEIWMQPADTGYEPFFLNHLQLRTLDLFWGDGGEGKLNQNTFRQTGESQFVSQELISRLKPSPNIRRLSIKGYLGCEFPFWMESDAIHNLTVLELINCKTVETLPMLGQLPFLKCLNIQGMDNVLEIGNEFSGGAMRPFPSLNELTLQDFPELRIWEVMGSTEAFPCLKRLSIMKCPLLKTMPSFPTLQHLMLQDCHPLLLRSAADLRTLLTLVIDSFRELDFIPKVLLENCLLLVSLTVISCPMLPRLPANLGRITALKSLKIGWCEMLYSLPRELSNLVSLENLEIIECPSLITLPEQSLERLSSLRSLSIENCNGFTSLPRGMQHATALERLTVMYCSNLASLPDGLQNLLVLKSLTILSCPDLASLPDGVQHMKMLQNLEIRICPKLMALPKVKDLISLRSLAISDCQNIKSLPEGIKQLSEFQHLSIQDCPELEKRCKKGKGEDWLKISHIPYVYIGASVLQNRQDTAASSSSFLVLSFSWLQGQLPFLEFQYLQGMDAATECYDKGMDMCHQLSSPLKSHELELKIMCVVFEKVASRVLKEITYRCGFNDEIQKLQRPLRMIQAVLEDPEEGQAIGKALKLWLTELKEVAYDADDLLEEFTPEALRQENDNTFTQQVSNIIPSLNPIITYLRKLPELTQIRQRLDVLLEEGSCFKLKEKIGDKDMKHRQKRETRSFVIEPEVIGREEDKEKIIGMLLLTTERRAGRFVSVIPLVGLGGIGKTTLAQTVYNDERVMRNFEMRMWVCVNEDFNVRKILNLMIESATRRRCDDLLGMDALQFQVRDLLLERRYLLVLDDVWNEDEDEWDKLKMLLKFGAEESKVIVTTRSAKVAVKVGTVSSHSLKGLSDDECWALFKQRAFSHGQKDNPNLFPIGKQLVKECEGVPLAAKTLGGLMRFKREPAEWLCVQESDLWIICEEENGILPVLRLSYSRFPSHLKGTLEMNTSINNLLWMLFFEDLKKNDVGDVIECKMHGIIHDLAKSVAGEEYFVFEGGCMPRNLAKLRYLSVVCDSGSCTIPEALYKAKKLRTLILLYPKSDIGEIATQLFSSFRYLRVLDLGNCGIKKVQNTISCLKYLRYLNLSNTFIEILPESICSLHNLQVLNLSGCFDLIELPRSLARLLQLRHLIINGCERLTRLPGNFGRLHYLQTLPLFIVSNETNLRENDNLIGLRRLKLKGELPIRKLENVKLEFLAQANLVEKNLLSLELSWGDDHEGLNLNMNNDFICKMGENVLECLQPPENLKRELPFLEIIYMRGIKTLKVIGREFYGEDTRRLFQSLKELTLIDFPDLELWWSISGGKEYPSLVKLIINKCPRLLNLPQFPSIKHLELRNCHEVLLRSVVNVSSLCILVIDVFTIQLVLLDNLLQNNANLMSLTISSCPKIRYIPPSLENLVNLKTLMIYWCEELVSLPLQLQNLSCLQSLEICECHSLSAPPQSISGLISLKYLSIENYSHIRALPIGLEHLSSLEHLTIIYCPSLVFLLNEWQNISMLRSLCILSLLQLSSLPDSIQYARTLRNLEIHGCPSLNVLPQWIINLTLLRSLAISNCPNITSLLDSLQCFTNLQRLSIQECPRLEEHCKKNIGDG